jgi:hypothetical protein
MLLCAVIPLHAATVNASSCALTDVQNAVNKATTGDTVVIPAGICTWHAQLVISSGITLQGAGVGNTIIGDGMYISSTGKPSALIDWTCQANAAHRMTSLQFQDGPRGLQNPFAAPSVTVDTTSGSLPAGKYFVVYTTYNSSGQTAASPEASVVLPSPGTITVNMPAVPPGAAGYKIYISTSAGAETGQGTTTGSAAFSLSIPLVAGPAPPQRNQTVPETNGIIRFDCTNVGTTTVRIDHNKFDHLNGIALRQDTVVGVIDHNEFLSSLNNVPLFIHDQYWSGTWGNNQACGGISDAGGDCSWASPVNWGSSQFLFVEDNSVTFDPGSSSACFDGYDGVRAVYRFNTLVRCTISLHGTESPQRHRGSRAVEVYQNTSDFSNDPTGRANIVDLRSGAALIWGNTSLNGVNNPASATLDNMRILNNFINGFNGADGNPSGGGKWDINNINNPFAAYTVSAVPASLQVTVNNVAWTTNQWANYTIRKTSSGGLPCTQTLSTDHNCFALIASNTSNTITYVSSTATGFNPDLIFSPGDSFEINLVTTTIDQVGRGGGSLISGVPPVVPGAWNDQTTFPAYEWLNSNNGADINFLARSMCVTCRENEHFYNYNPAGTFDGTKGVGVGPKASMPATCTPGVWFWATDEGNWNTTSTNTADGDAYQCTTTNVWTLAYLPFTYPHPLAVGSGISSNPGPTAFMTSPANGAVVFGNSVTLTATLSASTVGVAGVQFILDGVDVGSEVVASPYSITWDTTAASNGPHTLAAEAWLIGGGSTIASPVTVVVNNASYSSYSIADLAGQSWNLTKTGPVNVEYARVQPSPGTLAPGALSIFGFNNGGVLVSESAVAASAPVASGRIYVENGNLARTGIVLTNPSGRDTVVSFYFTGANGSTVKSGSYTLAANHEVATFLDQAPFNGPVVLNGTFTFKTSPGPVSAMGFRGSLNEFGDFVETSLPVTPLGQWFGAEELAFPHFVTTGSWVADVVLINPTDSVLTGTLQFFSQPSKNGMTSVVVLTTGTVSNSVFPYSIPTRGQFRMTTTAARIAWALITPAANTPAPSAVSLLSYLDDQKILSSEVSLAASVAGSAFRTYVEASGVPGQIGAIRSGVSLLNASNVAGTVHLSLYNLDGTPSGLSFSASLPSNGMLYQLIDQFLPQMPIPFRGILRVTSTVPMVVNALRVRWNERTDLLMTATPPLNESVVPSASEADLPYVVVGGGYSTQVVIFSGSPGSAAAGTLSFINADGTVSLSQTLQPQP